jgi:hypothetical protein
MRSKTPPNGPAAWWGLRTICVHDGQYRKETLIARFGGDVLMPDVRHLQR